MVIKKNILVLPSFAILNVPQNSSTMEFISGIIKKYCSNASQLLAIPFIPPRTFIARFSCSMASSAPIAECGTVLLFT